MNDIESRIHRGISQMAPDVFQNVLADKSPRLETEIWMTKEEPKDNRNIWMRAARTAALAAACCVLILGLGVYQMILKVDSVVEIDVNPSLELEINKSDRVVRMNALNADGVKILDNLEDDLKHAKLDEAVHALVDTMVSDGYLDQESSSVLVSVSQGNEERSTELQLMVADNVKETLKEEQIKGVVYHQSYEASDSISEMARKYEISPGKACFIQKLILKRPDFTVEELAKLSISEITRLLEEESVDMSEYVAQKPASEKLGEEASDTEGEIRLAVNKTETKESRRTEENIRPNQTTKGQMIKGQEDSLESPAPDPGQSLDGGIKNVVTDSDQQVQDGSVTGGTDQDKTDIPASEEDPGKNPELPEGEDPGENLGGNNGGASADQPEVEEPGGAAGLGSGDKEEPDGSLSQWEDVTDVPEPVHSELVKLMASVDHLVAEISSMEPLDSAEACQEAYNTSKALLVKGRNQYECVHSLVKQQYANGILTEASYRKTRNVLIAADNKLDALSDYLEIYGKMLLS